MSDHLPQFTRRDFIRGSAAVAGATLLAPVGAALAQRATTKPTATDMVALNKTGIKLTRVGIGTGVNNGADNLRGGVENFVKTIRHAYDQGIRYLDCAQRYQTFGSMKEAIKGLPREQLYIQTKIWPVQGQDVMAEIDKHRKNFDTDYLDTVLIHCQMQGNWADQWKAMRDVYDQAKEKKWIRAKGVSCHSVAALETAQKTEWADVHLVRINPLGMVIDGPNQGWNANARNPVEPIVEQVKQMHDKGRGVIGMKIFGNGFMTSAEDREKSVRFALGNPNIDAIVIGMTSPEQIDENLNMVNKVLAELVPE